LLIIYKLSQPIRRLNSNFCFRMILIPNEPFQVRVKNWARVFALCALSIALLQFIGVLFNIGFLGSPLPDLSSMNLVSAWGIMMTAAAFILRFPKNGPALRHVISNVIIGFVLLSSIWRFFAFILMDRVSLPVLLDRESISTSTAFCSALIAIVLLLMNSNNLRRVSISQYIAAFIVLYSIFSIAVNSYHAQSFKGIFTVPMSIYSAICFLLIAVASLLANSANGWMKELTSQYAGSIMARRFIPAVIILPFLYGFARIYFQMAGYYDTRFGTALAVLAISITGLIVILYNAIHLNKRDLLNRQAEQNIKQLNIELEAKVMKRTEELHRNEQKFRKLLENNYEIISLTDENFNAFYRSPASERITGWTSEERLKAGGGLQQTHPEDLEKIKNAMEEVLTNKEKSIHISFRTRHRDGHYLWLEGFMMNMLHDESLKGIVSNFRDVTKRRQAEDEISNMTVELRQLLEHLQSSREDERKYIAREIHDELGSSLTALKIDVSLMHKKSVANQDDDGNGVKDELDSVIQQIDKAIDSVKKISTELRPEILDHLGIIDALNWRVQQFENMTGIPCKVSYLPKLINLRKEISVPVYRIVQEALTNIARHSKASFVKILVKSDEQNVLVEINDNGKGIRDEDLKNPKAFGLIGMRERVRILNGSMFIIRNQGMGTTVSVKIPVY
jgi:PAS domain S-box-containing protein